MSFYCNIKSFYKQYLKFKLLFVDQSHLNSLSVCLHSMSDPPGLKSHRITSSSVSHVLIIDGTDEGRSRLNFIEIYHLVVVPFARGKSTDDSFNQIAVQI